VSYWRVAVGRHVSEALIVVVAGLELGIVTVPEV
jgi:hypothetical protein